ncbi:SH2 domain-containing protein [Pontixanthobacter aquaemixtae]|uniref:Uncharacterized protein n=1 Tax=Pontixanthobacter aquaemixtae TaxID=1958940 RepID=A0A844ZN47_9SPHN|nr:hypothetical protein [Pontixanthobacter aquaemixtae]MXO89275.1 hypothetical protein [Pontixanthobacter aquaemixtae]
MTTLTFDGTEKCLKDWLEDEGIFGIWSDQPNGVKMLRCGKQVQIHWSSTKGSLWVSGKADAKRKMEKRLESALAEVDVDYADFDLVE